MNNNPTLKKPKIRKASLTLNIILFIISIAIFGFVFFLPMGKLEGINFENFGNGDFLVQYLLVNGTSPLNFVTLFTNFDGMKLVHHLFFWGILSPVVFSFIAIFTRKFRFMQILNLISFVVSFVLLFVVTQFAIVDIYNQSGKDLFTALFNNYNVLYQYLRYIPALGILLALINSEIVR